MYCRTGNRKEAARQLGVSETAVAMQMNKLLSRLGAADPFSAARALGWLVIPEVPEEPRADARPRWPTREGVQARTSSGVTRD